MSRKNKEWDLGSMLSVVGFVFELVRVIVNALRKRNGTVDHLRRLLNEPALVDQVFDLIVDTSKQTVWPVWKTVKLGTHKTIDEFRTAITTAGCQISDWASQILIKTSLASEETTLDLVLLTTAELTGKPSGGTTAEVFKGAARLGLKKCPAEVGPALREQYLNQPLGEWILVGMESISDSDGDPSVFSVDYVEGGRWLSAFCASPAGVWNPGCRWVFSVCGKQ